MTSSDTLTALSAGIALRPAQGPHAFATHTDAAGGDAHGRNRPRAWTKAPGRAQRVAAGSRAVSAVRAQDKAQQSRSQARLLEPTKSSTCNRSALGMRLALFSPRLGRMDDYPEMLAIVRALARYLRANPNSSDTADGIAMWWFREQTVVDGRALLDALDWMRERGLVEMLSASSTGDRYRCIAGPDELDGVLQELSRRRLT
ncbi:hypothetical protein [Lysobacter sp. Root559]|uniref:hypothetical protein n=1 Tax=Lysobacter sp. Root559 TaxID=1736559 RepID=UPI0012FA9D51|nr:hypothetical protein [Lysobacter sp. Root559]